MSQNKLPNKTDRESLLAALSAGQAPPEIAPSIQVGRKDVLLAVKADIGRVEAGASCFRIVAGPPGSGKTQLLNIAGELGLRHDFLVVRATLTRTLRLHGPQGE